MPLWLHGLFLGLSLAASWLLTPLAASLARRRGILDHPSGRKIHLEPKPLLGGAAVFLAFYGVVYGALAAAFLLEGYPGLSRWLPDFLEPYLLNIVSDHGAALTRLHMIAAGGAAVFALGLMDDLKGLGVAVRLALQALIAAVVVLAGVRPELGFLPSWAAAGAAVLWIVAVTNAFNFIDSLDGEAAGVGAIAALILGAAMARWSQPLVALPLFVLAGALLGFLRHNFYPATVFLGSAGSLLIGYLLSVITLVSTFIVSPRQDFLPIVMPVLVMGIPLYDLLSVVAIRRLRQASIFQGDQSHLGHRLMRRGFTQKQAVLCIYLLAFCTALNALLLPVVGTLDSLLVLGQVLALFGVVVLLERIRIQPE